MPELTLATNQETSLPLLLESRIKGALLEEAATHHTERQLEILAHLTGAVNCGRAKNTAI